MRRLLLSFFIIFIVKANAAKVDTINIYSKAMNKTFKCVVIKPNTYNSIKKFPVVYLLHGYSGKYSNWITKVPLLKKEADKYQMLIVCPDGGYSSWYYDSPIDSTMKYETYIGQEVINFIDKKYTTIANRKHRAITGLSMGGHGALYLTIRNAQTFGAAGSMSGGVDINASRAKFDIAKRIGDTVNYASNWKNYSVINMVENFPKDSIEMIIDCGTEDFFYDINKQLHQKLIELKIPHDYCERPGAHNWKYWENSVQYQLLFFSNFFKRS